MPLWTIKYQRDTFSLSKLHKENLKVAPHQPRRAWKDNNNSKIIITATINWAHLLLPINPVNTLKWFSGFWSFSVSSFLNPNPLSYPLCTLLYHVVWVQGTMPWTGLQSSKGHTLSSNLLAPISLNKHVLEWRRKPECQGKAHTQDLQTPHKKNLSSTRSQTADLIVAR